MGPKSGRVLGRCACVPALVARIPDPPAPKKQSRLHFGASRASSLGKGRQKTEAETANRAGKWPRRAPEIGLPTYQNAYTSAVSHSELRRLAEQRFRNIINVLCSPALISVLSLVLVER